MGKDSTIRWSLLQSEWPEVLDPRREALPEAETFDPEDLRTELEAWLGPLPKNEFKAVGQLLMFQGLYSYEPGHQLYGFGSKSREALIVLDGLYVRVFGRKPTAGDPKLTYYPFFQAVQSGCLLTPAAIGNPNEESPAIEMCVCVKKGRVIRVVNPEAIRSSPGLLRGSLRSRDYDFAWLKSRLGLLLSTEDRVKALLSSLAAFKEVQRFDDEECVFSYPVSQNALAEFLGLSDNTLRPYLQTKNYRWANGRLLLTNAFVAAARNPLNFGIVDALPTDIAVEASSSLGR